nr:ABC transporter ATP-binding protein [Candidatus Freyarchaeota archaeon]
MAAVETLQLVKVFNNVVAVNRLSMTVPERSCFGFLGPNGAGKTTTVKILTGLTRPTQGTATVFDMDILTEMDRIRKLIGYMPEIGPKPKEKALDHLVALASINSSLGRRSLMAQAMDLLEILGLWEARNKKIHTFSMGMFKKWLLASALMGEPEILFLDEPTANLDPISKIEILDLIKKFSKERTVFMNSHVLSEVERIADHVAILNRGKLVVQDTVKQLQERISEGGRDFILKSKRKEELKEFLEPSKEVLKVTLEEDGLRIATTNPDALWGLLAKAYYESGITVTEFREISMNLEDVFVKIIKEEELG